MAKKKSDKKKPKNDDNKRKSADKQSTQKSTDKSPDAAKAKDSSGKGAKKSSQPSSKSSEASDGELQSSQLTEQLETIRKRLNQIDSECRDKIEQQALKYQRKENEQLDKIREDHQVELDEEVKQVKEEYELKIEAAVEKIDKQQKETMAQVKAEDAEANRTTDDKRAQLEKEIKARKEETQADIERYRKRRQIEMDEQIKRLQEQLEADVKEYTNKRMETNELLLEQLKQKLDFEVKNEQQKGQMATSLKLDKLKEQCQKAQFEETTKLNQTMAQVITELRARKATALEQTLADFKKTIREEMDKAKALIEDKFAEERAKLKAKIDAMQDKFKDKLKQDQRELEHRKKTKQELLAMLAMTDTRKLTDEDFIATRFGYKIERSEIMVQSGSSTIYQARKEGGPSCFCKVTMLNKWSVRHRSDFGKHSTRLVRYLTANYSKAPYFVKVVDVFATESKLYTLMEPLDSSKTLDEYLDAKGKQQQAVGGKPDKSVGASPIYSRLSKAELVNLLSQVVKAIYFLNNNFIAHANLTPDNITLLGASDLTDCKLVLTGLTRPLVFFNVETDLLISIKGFDLSTDGDSVDHLPPECFESEFQPASLDSYSIGVLAYQLVRVRSPYVLKCGNSAKKIVAAKQADSVQLVLDAKDKDNRALPQLVGALTMPQSGKRIQVEDILKHSYFKQ